MASWLQRGGGNRLRLLMEERKARWEVPGDRHNPPQWGGDNGRAGPTLPTSGCKQGFCLQAPQGMANSQPMWQIPKVPDLSWLPFQIHLEYCQNPSVTLGFQAQLHWPPGQPALEDAVFGAPSSVEDWVFFLIWILVLSAACGCWWERSSRARKPSPQTARRLCCSLLSVPCTPLNRPTSGSGVMRQDAGKLGLDGSSRNLRKVGVGRVVGGGAQLQRSKYCPSALSSWQLLKHVEISFVCAVFTLGKFWGWICGWKEEPVGERGFVWERRGTVDKETWGAGHHAPSLASALSHLLPG